MGSACHCPVIIFKWQFESWGGGVMLVNRWEISARELLLRMVLGISFKESFILEIFNVEQADIRERQIISPVL